MKRALCFVLTGMIFYTTAISGTYSSVHNLYAYITSGISHTSGVVAIEDTLLQNIFSSYIIDEIVPVHPNAIENDTIRYNRNSNPYVILDNYDIYKIVVVDTNDIAMLSQQLNNYKYTYYIHRNTIAEPHYVPNDTEYSDQWQYREYIPPSGQPNSLNGSGVEQAWDLTKGNNNVTIVILDATMHAPSHPDLSTPNRCINDARINTNDPTGIFDQWHNSVGTTRYHGYEVASVCINNSDNNTGVAGVNWYCSYGVRGVVNAPWDDPMESHVVADRVYDIIDYASNTEDNIIINCSFSWPENLQLLEALKEAYNSHNIIICTSMGNNDNSPEVYVPAAGGNHFVCAVGGVYARGYNYGNIGTHKDICAPSYAMLVASKPDQNRTGHQYYYEVEGTSYASPLVAGVASLIWGERPELDNDDVIGIMKVTTNDLGQVGYDEQYGEGLIDAYAAVSLVNGHPVYHFTEVVTGYDRSVQENFGEYYYNSLEQNLLGNRFTYYKSIELPYYLENNYYIWGKNASSSGSISPGFGNAQSSFTGGYTGVSQTLQYGLEIYTSRIYGSLRFGNFNRPYMWLPTPNTDDMIMSYGVVSKDVWGGKVFADATMGPGDVYLSEDLIIEEDAELTILPGTNIIPLDYEPKIIVYGKIIAEGTETNNIVFNTVNQSNNSGIRVELNKESSSESILRYCQFNKSRKAILIRNEQEETINNNIFNGCTIGIEVRDLNDVLYLSIESNIFNGDQLLTIYEKSIFINNSGSMIGIWNNTFNDEWKAIEVRNSDEVWIIENIIEQDTYMAMDYKAIEANNSHVIIRNNEMTGMGQQLDEVIYRTPVAIDISNNTTGYIIHNWIENYYYGIRETSSDVSILNTHIDTRNNNVVCRNGSNPSFRSIGFNGRNRFIVNERSWTNGIQMTDYHPIIEYGENTFISSENESWYNVIRIDYENTSRHPGEFEMNYWNSDPPRTASHHWNNGHVYGLITRNDLPYSATYDDIIPCCSRPMIPWGGYYNHQETGDLTNEYLTNLEYYEQMYEIGQDSLLQGNYLYASTKYKQAALCAEKLEIRAASIIKLAECYETGEVNDQQIPTFLEGLKDTTVVERIERVSGHALARCDVHDGAYASAIAYYESIMTEKDISESDSIDAVISAMGVYITKANTTNTDPYDTELQGALASAQILGQIASLKPISYMDYKERIDILNDIISPYKIHQYVITDSVIWGYNGLVILDQDVTIEEGGYLEILPGTTVWGDSVSIIVEGEMRVCGTDSQKIEMTTKNDLVGVEGISIIIEKNSSNNTIIENCVIKRSKIAIEMNETINNPIKNCEIHESECGIKVLSANSIIVQVDSCLFISDSVFTKEAIHIYNPGSGSRILNCEFVGAMIPIYATSGNLSVENCYIDNVDTLSTLSEIAAIEFVNMTGTIRRNTIYRYPSGVLLYDSDPVFARNKIEECGNEGLWLIDGSYPDMTDASTGAYNWLRYNGADHDTSTQVRIAGKLYPYMKNGQNNIWQAAGGYAFVATGLPSSTIELIYNYWGTTSAVPTDLFSNYCTNIKIEPYNKSATSSPNGYRTQTVYDDLLSQALAAIAIDDYSTAIENLEDIVLEDTLDHNRIGAVSLLTDCWIQAENDIPTLMAFLQGLADSTWNDRIVHEALHCKAQLNIELGNYEDAIDFYEGVILDPTASFEDSICAIIDAGRIYLLQNGDFEQLSVPDGGLAEVTPAKSNNRETAANGFQKDIQPQSYGAYVQRSHELISELRRQTSSEIEEIALPERFALHQNYPNPFNPATTLRFDLPKNAHVKMFVYNILGQRVLTVLDRNMAAGFHTVSLNMQPYASGVYFYAIQAGEYSQVKKMVLLK